MHASTLAAAQGHSGEQTILAEGTQA